MEGIQAKLFAIQQEITVPKSNKNNFGGYMYRSCEDILTNLKPLCKKHNCLIKLDDEIAEANGHVYIKAIATIIDLESDKAMSTTALAREAVTKKGMDDSQMTGTASSYARKYALNGLLALDDTKDADTNEFQKQKKRYTKKPVQKKTPAPEKKIDLPEGSPMWTSDYKGEMYIFVKTGDHFTAEGLSMLNMKPTKKNPQNYYAMYTEDIKTQLVDIYNSVTKEKEITIDDFEGGDDE